MVKPSTVVIDGGINRTQEGLLGDVDGAALAPSFAAGNTLAASAR